MSTVTVEIVPRDKELIKEARGKIDNFIQNFDEKDYMYTTTRKTWWGLGKEEVIHHFDHGKCNETLKKIKGVRFNFYWDHSPEYNLWGKAVVGLDDMTTIGRVLHLDPHYAKVFSDVTGREV